MYYKLKIILNDYTIERSFIFNNYIYITKIYPINDLLNVLFLTKENKIKVSLFYFDSLIFESNEITLPQKMYKLYNYKGRKLYTHCIELDEYLIGIDVMNIYKIKYFSSFFIMKKNTL